MNKTLRMLTLALTICAAICGTAHAAPRGGSHHGGKAPTVVKAQPVRKHTAKAPAPAKHTAKVPAKGHPHPAKAEPRHVAAHHANPPVHHGMHHEPERRHHHHHGSTLHTEDWCEIGASLLGGLVGGLIGSNI